MEKIDGLEIHRIKKFKDSRGFLYKPFTSKFLKSISFDFKEIWYTISNKNTIRGMHMQLGDNPARKLVTIIEGEILDVLIDTRKESKTYGVINSYHLKSCSETGIILDIPVGVCHGYKVIKDNTVVMYSANNFHDSGSDIGFRWDSIGFEWKIENPIISERDKQLPPFILL
jgi:dTDP-4-dehydrorhamnose 3,5-epimerase/CDP-3, 6-dideoxy-D-glycero-D-glycero-4-hexulose-5-epimerase